MNQSTSTPEQVVEQFVDGWNNRDAKQLAAIFVEDAEFVNVTGLWWHSKERIYKAHDYGLKVIFNHSTLRLIRTKVRYLSDDIAFVHARMSIVDQTGFEEHTKPEKRSNIFVFVVRKEAEGWRCHAAQNTEVLKGKETFVVDQEGRIQAINYGKFDKKNFGVE